MSKDSSVVHVVRKLVDFLAMKLAPNARSDPTCLSKLTTTSLVCSILMFGSFLYTDFASADGFL